MRSSRSTSQLDRVRVLRRALLAQEPPPDEQDSLLLSSWNQVPYEIRRLGGAPLFRRVMARIFLKTGETDAKAVITRMLQWVSTTEALQRQRTSMESRYHGLMDELSNANKDRHTERQGIDMDLVGELVGRTYQSENGLHKQLQSKTIARVHSSPLLRPTAEAWSAIDAVCRRGY